MKIRLINPDNINLEKVHKTWWFWFSAVLCILFFYFKLLPQLNGDLTENIFWGIGWTVLIYLCSLLIGLVIVIICTIIEYAVNGQSKEIIKFIRDIFK